MLAHPSGPRPRPVRVLALREFLAQTSSLNTNTQSSTLDTCGAFEFHTGAYLWSETQDLDFQLCCELPEAVKDPLCPCWQPK